MKSSHVAIAGGVFAAVLVGCFLLIGFGSDGEPPVPGPVAVAPPPAVAEAVLPAPKVWSAAAGGVGELARPERGYDGAAALARSSSSGESEVATWTLPAADLREFGDIYHDVRLTGDRLVAVSDTGVRVLDARTGESAGVGLSAERGFPETALSPHGDWAVQPAVDAVTLIDTATGKATKLPATAGRSFTGPAAFGPANGWCAVVGTEGGKAAVFRVRKGGGAVESVGTFRPDSTRGDVSRVARLHAAEGGRFVVERPAERSPAARLLAWTPPGQALRPLPAFGAATHDGVTRFHLAPDGKRGAMFDAATLTVVDLDANRVLLTHAPENLKIGGVAFSPDGSRLVVAYESLRVNGDTENGEPEKSFLPGYAWVLDVATREAVGSQLQFGDLGIGKGVRRCVLSGDGSRLAVVEANGKVHLVDTSRAFGPGALTGAPAGQPSAPRPAKDRDTKADT